MIEALEGFPDNVVAFACRGHVSRKDYDDVLVPAVEQALENHDRIRLYYEVGEDFTGIEPGAAWEDFMVGMEHLLRWERMAVVTDVEWIATTMKMFSFVTPIRMKVFENAQADEARAWIVAEG
jgi:hypothetical protein